ncbi:unnamed protein product, partial [Rotaria magnacalcarata]
FAKSITRCITPVTVYFKDIGAYGQDSIILCDSPGFGDTNGPEVDIANGIAIVRAIRVCESVKPVLLISYTIIGDRYEVLKDLTYTLARLIQNTKDQIKAFSFIFTKYPKNEKETIHVSLETINNTLSDQERSDTNFMDILRDMFETTKKNACVLDPIKNDPSTILDDLADTTNINHPENVFQFFITEKSKSILDKQVTKYELSIKSATKRSKYSLVKYILDQLKFLNELLNQESIEEIYINYETILIDEEIKQYRTYFDHANLVEDLRKTHLGNEAIHSCAYIEHLNGKVDNSVKNLQEKDINDLSIKLNTFNLDKSNEPVYKAFDYYTVEKALVYLDACKTFFILKNDSILILNCLENYIRNYINFIKDEIKGYFDIIKQNKIGNENIEIKTTCNRIFSCFHRPIETIIKDWNKLLSDYLNELSEEMHKLYLTQSMESLENKLSIIKILSNLDWFLKDKKYIDLYHKYQEKLLLQVHDIDKEIIVAIKNFDYELLDDKMTALRPSNKIEKHFYEKAKRSLSIGLNQLKEDTRGSTLVVTHHLE